MHMTHEFDKTNKHTMQIEIETLSIVNDANNIHSDSHNIGHDIQ